MSPKFETNPAYTFLPGTVVTEDGVIFSMVFRNCDSCGLILYHLPDFKETKVPFTDKCRYGSLYSVKIKSLDPCEWAYRYYRDDCSFEDPYGRELLEVRTEKGIRTASKLFYSNEDTLPPYGNISKKPFSDQIIYSLHVKGFTASSTSKARHKGTFTGVTEKIPYLKKLGINAVELLPVYELRPEELDMAVGAPKDINDKTRYNISISGEPGNNTKEKKPNYWNFGEGCYFAPKKSYSEGDPQHEFSKMVNSFHKNGILVYLQLFFPDNVSIQTQLETVRFYVTHYQIDGFHLKGGDQAIKTIASDPMLSETAVFYYSFPYQDLTKEDQENPTAGKPSVKHLCEYNDSFSMNIRQFVKSDNNILREFMQSFIDVPQGHGRVHYTCGYDGFTLMDLVSYNWKHNEANGEDNHDGTDSNYSWNCGFEGPCQKKDVRLLRMRQMKNFMLLTMLAQGTPVINMGDERCNSQDGNNNPYCQDNETGWLNWKDTADSKEMLSFTQKIISFRKEHAVFRRKTQFRFNDYKVVGYPDISFHGKEAWKPDFSIYSHTAGIFMPEQYAEENPSDSFMYLAVNMHWHNQMLSMPTLPKEYEWKAVIRTSEKQSFVKEDSPEAILSDQKRVFVPGRSITVLCAKRKKIKEPVATVQVIR